MFSPFWDFMLTGVLYYLLGYWGGRRSRRVEIEHLIKQRDEAAMKAAVWLDEVNELAAKVKEPGDG